jgi:two-component system sensor histidine kinase RegB
MNIHVLLMWLSLLLSACLLIYIFVSRHSLSRRRERELAAAREGELRREQVLAIAGLATGTTQELDAPLTTLTVLLEEMAVGESDPRRHETHQMMMEQIHHCKDVLDSLSRTAQLTESGEPHRVNIVEFTQSVVDQWLAQRSEASAGFEVSGEGEAPWLMLDFTLGRALENLLDNAADAWSKDIMIDVDWGKKDVVISVRDKGPGVAKDLIDKLGRPIIREGGVGLGLLLSHATALRYGGVVELENLPSGGARSSLRISRSREQD